MENTHHPPTDGGRTSEPLLGRHGPKSKEMDWVCHARGDISAEICNLIVDVGEESEARPTTHFHDCHKVAAIEPHSHGSASSEGV